VVRVLVAQEPVAVQAQAREPVQARAVPEQEPVELAQARELAAEQVLVELAQAVPLEQEQAARVLVELARELAVLVELAPELAEQELAEQELAAPELVAPELVELGREPVAQVSAVQRRWRVSSLLTLLPLRWQGTRRSSCSSFARSATRPTTRRCRSTAAARTSL
jgi:hypothetical protein